MSQEEQPRPPSNEHRLLELLDAVPGCEFIDTGTVNKLSATLKMLEFGTRRVGDPELVARARALIERAQESCKHIQSVLQDAALLKVDLRSPKDPAPVDVQALLDAMLRLTRIERERIAELQRDVESPLPRVVGDEAALARVVFTLLLNALGLMRSDPSRRHVLGVRLQRHLGRVLLTLSTTGPGIPSGLVPRLFDLLCPPLVPGAGQWVGLSLSQDCVQRMGGELRVESPPEGGVSFSLLLRVARRPQAGDAVARPEPWGGLSALIRGEEQRLRALQNDLRNTLRARVACLCLELVSSYAPLRSALKPLAGCLKEMGRKEPGSRPLSRKMLRGVLQVLAYHRSRARELRHMRYRPPGTLRPVGVHACLAAALRICHAGQVPELRLETDFAPRLPRVSGSEGHLRGVFLLLLRMCLWMWKGPRPRQDVLRVRTVQEGRWVRVTFSVTGHVLPREFWASVVDEGYHSGARESYALPLGHALLQAMGGDVRVDSEEGIGTNYTVRLPVAPGHGHDRGPAPTPSRRLVRAPPPRRLRAPLRIRPCETPDMTSATIAALEAAAASNTLHTWLAALPEDVRRWEVRRALELDRRLWTQHPASLASCLLARTLHLPGLAALREAWIHELDSRGIPWIRALRPLPVADGLLAELHADETFTFDGLHRPRFESEGIVLLEAIHFHPSVQAPRQRRKERLCWDWERGEAVLEPASQSEEPEARDRTPRFESDGWGPVYLVRAPGQAREPLPCPPGGSASARFSADGRRLFVYGTHDEYAGGFVYVVELATLAIERQTDTHAPVSTVHECSRAGLLLLNTYRGLVVWSGERPRPLPLTAKEASLSPSGRYVATFDGRLRLWLLSELLRVEHVPQAGFPSRFDPSGTRLLSGRRLSDGHTGEPIAELTPTYGEYLEGGPASKWLHFGERFLILMHSGLCAWDTRTGAPLRVEESLHFGSRYELAYDRAGSRLAVLYRGEGEVELYGLPEGRRLATRVFSLEGTELAMSPDGETLAVRQGLEVEVRAVSGALLRRFTHPGGDPTSGGPRHQGSTLRFSEDGGRIASFLLGDGWRLWSLEDEHVEHLDAYAALDSLIGFAVPRPGDWDLEAGTSTLFVHRPTGTHIRLPAGGPWVCNPAAPRYLASDDLHLELRAR
ncbi:histidine kinase/DNA gyrase B/HSP90-like ATPase [Archangium gephyra]|uniref:histidine kinase n=1 Tax=Archangium gephyra TaxID=48 RepID=A0AAC8TDV3_9BACT|nr:ATP-binding protein [Archangium gephyra]AKJ02355.1 Histidine kinase [Archangium gephyra]REG28717.1 histidine kinase/DNA gyrase B/HSP90-like ATPase [Archangium gephyra]